MRVTVEFDICESNGLCEGYLPAVFELDDDDLLQVHKQDLDGSEIPGARQAARACPRQAITLES